MNAMNEPVLVTGATGKTGRSLVALMNAAGIPHRAASRASGFDWGRPETWEAMLAGAAAAYLVAPVGVADATARMNAFLELAGQRGVRRFALLSMASLPAGGPGPGQAHQWLKDHSDDWTVLGPGAFMQNFSEGPFLASIRDEDTIYSNTGDGRAPFISTVDIARAAFAAQTAPAPLNRDFTLTGDESLSYDEVAERIGRATGRPITHTRISTPQMAQRFVARGVPEPTALFLAAGYETIGHGAQDHLADGLRALTGEPATTFQAFAEANVAAWAPN